MGSYSSYKIIFIQFVKIFISNWRVYLLNINMDDDIFIVMSGLAMISVSLNFLWNTW